MIDGLETLSQLIRMGKYLIDILFERKMTRREIEDMIDKKQFNRQTIKETFFVAISEHQELVFNEKGELYIKTKDIDKEQLKQAFLQMLKRQYEAQERDQWRALPKAEASDGVCLHDQNENPSSRMETIQELIDNTKRKHELLYGESY